MGAPGLVPETWVFGLLPRGWNRDRAGVAISDSLTRDRLKRFAEAELDAGKIAVMTADGDIPGGYSRVRIGKELLDFRGALARGLRGSRECRRNFDPIVGLAHHLKILLGGKAGAGPMRGPFVRNQARVGHDVEHRGWIGKPRRVRTLRWPLAVLILRPQPVNDKAGMGAIALQTIAMAMAILRRPGKREQVIIEVTGGRGSRRARIGNLRVCNFSRRVTDRRSGVLASNRKDDGEGCEEQAVLSFHPDAFRYLS